jgi:hypothetical protein
MYVMLRRTHLCMSLISPASCALLRTNHTPAQATVAPFHTARRDYRRDAQVLKGRVDGVQGDTYVDKWAYRETQGETKKKGFLTSDFSKRDEFSNTTRTGQWREQLQVSVKKCSWTAAVTAFSEW